MAEKDLPPNMLAEFAYGSGADDKRTKEKEKDKADKKEKEEPEMSEIEEELAKELEASPERRRDGTGPRKCQDGKGPSKCQDGKGPNKCAELVDENQRYIRGLGTLGAPEGLLKKAEQPGTGDMNIDDQGLLFDDKEYLKTVTRF